MKDIVKILILMYFLALGKVSLAQCDFYNEIRVSSSGFFAGVGYTQEYVVVSNETGLITAINSTGTFDPIQPGQYLVYAVNYDGARPGVLAVGNTWFPVTTFAAGNCMDIIGPYNSGLINVCNNICTDDPFSATASGFYSGGSTTENYILVPYPTGAILASNTSGAFTNTDYVSDGVYQVFAVNTEDATVLSTLDPTDSWASAETSINLNCADKIGPYLVEVGPGLCLLSSTNFKLNGEIKSSTNSLKWNIETSQNVKSFELEYSKDQSKFERIAILDNFQFEHKDPASKAYYRVKSNFENGDSKYSNTIELERTNTFEVLSIYPNPSNGLVNINLQSENGIIYYNLYNGLGQVIISNNLSLSEGISSFSIDVSKYPDAMYQLIITDGNTKHIEKISKVR